MFQYALALILQIALASLAFAAPVSIQGHGNAVQYGTGGGIVGFIVLILDIIVFLEVLKSNRTVPMKLLWCLLVFLLPIIGIIIYYLFSGRAEANSSGGYESIA